MRSQDKSVIECSINEKECDPKQEEKAGFRGDDGKVKQWIRTHVGVSKNLRSHLLGRDSLFVSSLLNRPDRSEYNQRR